MSRQSADKKSEDLPSHDFQVRLNRLADFSAHKLVHVAETSSTNDDLKADWQHLPVPQKVMVADFQTQGRGQYQRKWQGNPGQSLMFSFSAVVPAKKSLPASLLAGAAIIEALGAGELIWLKWPNDIWSKSGKIAGVLVECCQNGDQLNMVIGIGLNLKPLSGEGLRASSLQEAGVCVDRWALVLKILESWSRLAAKSNEEQVLAWKNAAGTFWKTMFEVHSQGIQPFMAFPRDLADDGALILVDMNGKNTSLFLLRSSLFFHEACELSQFAGIEKGAVSPDG
jgi:biotin-[acetyl-CoA-carboxylase] ligase BirA-like protein